MIVGYPAGSRTDNVAGRFHQAFQAALGQTTVMDVMNGTLSFMFQALPDAMVAGFDPGIMVARR